MMKAIGIIMIIAATFGFAYMKSAQQVQQIREIRQIGKALCLLKSGIAYEAVGIPELLEQIGVHTEGEVGDFFHRVGELLTEYQKETFAELWNREIQVTSQRLKLPDLLTDSMKQLGNTLGANDGELQGRQIDRVILEAEACQKELLDKYRNDSKMNYALATAVGAMTVIILF